MYETVVIVGRFQPLHLGHLDLIKKALETGERVLIAIGSHNSSRSSKNPFTSIERENLLKQILDPSHLKRIHFCKMEDRLNDNIRWAGNLIRNVLAIHKNSTISEKQIAVIGHAKDKNLYQTFFPDWDFIDAHNDQTHLINATGIRTKYFTNHSPDLIDNIPEITKQFLKDFKYNNPSLFFNLAEEHQFLIEYNKKWDNTPYPVNFVTVDNVVCDLKKSKVLLIERKDNPGKGTIALPGGFVDRNETIQGAAIRELKEETNINLLKDELVLRIIGKDIFDAPNRSMRGRIITHPYLIDVTDLDVSTRAGDDASKVFWVDFKDLPNMQSKFYSDHYEILEHMLKEFVYTDLNQYKIIEDYI